MVKLMLFMIYIQVVMMGKFLLLVLRDVLDYIISVGCQYYFNYIPLQKLGLPVPQA